MSQKQARARNNDYIVRSARGRWWRRIVAMIVAAPTVFGMLYVGLERAEKWAESHHLTWAGAVKTACDAADCSDSVRIWFKPLTACGALTPAQSDAVQRDLGVISREVSQIGRSPRLNGRLNTLRSQIEMIEDGHDSNGLAREYALETVLLLRRLNDPTLNGTILHAERIVDCTYNQGGAQ
jgi:hypothetical protein